MRRLGKKGMMDDFFDFIFTVIVAFFLFSFIFWTLDYSIKNSNDESIAVLKNYQRLDSAVNNLRSEVYLGYNLEDADLDAKIKESKILGGKTITDCPDYVTEGDCTNDPVGLYSGPKSFCRWNEKRKKCERVILA
ncbi:hypothetical protein HYX11_02335 [Candidatus Woesearchaeota archaeon]|nr:hypothetical protein [Candidatus Woesearchaeota archaeon]